MRFSRPTLWLILLLVSAPAFAGQSGPARLRIIPQDQVVSPTGTVPYSAILLFFKGSGLAGGEKDVTGSVTWSSSDSNVASIDSHTGVATASASGGSCIITARLGPFTVSVPLTVNNATLSSITVSPGTPSLPLGRKMQFSATGNYSDNSHHDLTDEAAWSAGTGSVASVDPVGFVVTHGQGTSSINAAFAGVTGSTTLTVTAPVLDFLRLSQLAVALPYITATQQLTLAGVFSDGSTQNYTSSATWSSNSSAVNVSSSGLLTGASATSSPATVQASISGQTVSAQVTVQALVIAGVSSSPAMPLSVIQIATLGFIPNPSTINVQFSGGGFSVSKQPIRIETDGTIKVAVPLYVNPSTGLIGAGTVSLTLTETAASVTQSPTMTFGIQDLPSLASLGVKPGQITHAFLVFETVLHARRMNEFQAASVLQSATDTFSPQYTMQTLLEQTMLARGDVDSVITNKTPVIPWATLKDGTVLQLDSKQIQLMDRILAVYLIEQFQLNSVGAARVQSYLASRSPSKSGAALPATSFGGVLSFISTSDGIADTVLTLRDLPNPADGAVGVIDGLSFVLKSQGANKTGGAVGLIGALVNFQEAVDSLLHDIGTTASCNADPTCSAEQAQDIQNALNKSGAQIVSADAAAIATIPDIAELDADVSNATTAISQFLQSVATVTGEASNGDVGNSDSADVAVAPVLANGHSGQVGGHVNVSTTLGSSAPQSSLDLCCFYFDSQDMVGLADPDGNYFLFAPLGDSSTTYSSLSISAVDPLGFSTLASEPVNLSGLNPSTRISVPPMSYTCSDPDAGSGDADDPDCD